MKHLDKHMNHMDKKHAAKHKSDAKEMMSDMDYSHCQHEMSESPKYEKMEERGVKLLKAMKGPKGGMY